MNGIEFYRGPKGERPMSRSHSERYDEIGEKSPSERYDKLGVRSHSERYGKLGERSQSEIYDELRGTQSSNDYSKEKTGYTLYNGSNYSNAHVVHDDSREDTAYKKTSSKSCDTGKSPDSVDRSDTTEKQKSFLRLITRFAEKTSMQGVPYINSAKFWWARLIWCFMLLVAIVAMSLHLWYLVDQYTDYPVQTKISLGFESLKFPQITICNTNVMHKGRLDKYDNADKLKNLLEKLKPENLVPDQFDPDYDPFALKAPSGGQQSSGNQGQKGPPQGLSGKAGGLQDGFNTGKGNPLKRKRRFLKQYKTFNKTHFGGKDLPNFRKLLPKDKNDFDGEVDSRTELEDLFDWLFMAIPKRDRAELGHNITDMLLSCTYNGRICSPDMFTLHQTSEYGNCWSITSNKFKVKHSGPSAGLSMVFYLEATEYLKGLTTGYGARIQVHEPQTYPYPAKEGLFIPASMETDIGLRMVSISRESGLYGKCNDGKKLEKTTSFKYTRSACQMHCMTNQIMENCLCFDKNMEELAKKRNNGLKPCRNESEIMCMAKIEKDFVKKEFPCSCANSCNEVLYVKSVSQRQWPDDDYAMILLEKICNKDPTVCSSLRKFLGFPTKIKGNREISNNFLKLNIYYEDLNYENLTEVPEIELQQFLSDVGGAIGLWIGLSILSLCELIQLFVELCDYGIFKAANETKKGRAHRMKTKMDIDIASVNDTMLKGKDSWTRQQFNNHSDKTRSEYDVTQSQRKDRSGDYLYDGSDVIYYDR